MSSSNAEEAKRYREKLNSLNFGKVPGGTRDNGKLAFRDKPNMNIEGAVQGERRPDGSFMPYVREDHVPITSHMRTNMGERKFTSAVRDATQGNNPT